MISHLRSMMLWIIPAAPLAAAGLGLAVKNVSVAKLATLGAALIAFAASLAVASDVARHVGGVLLPGWVGVNALAALILVLQSFVGLTAAAYSWGYIPHIAAGDPARQRRYYVNLNLFQASLFVVPLLLQPVLTWVAVELTTVLSIFLVSFDNTREALEAAWKYAVITIMGATVAAFGIFLLLWGLTRNHVTVQTWSALIRTAPHMPAGVVELAFVLILIGFGAKVGLVPMHTWLPDAHSQAPTPVCALLSGVEVSTVLYVILRLWPVFTAVHGFSPESWALVVGLVSVGTAAFLLLQVHDYKRLFAFSTVEHMGILLLCLGLGPLGALACVYQLTTHGLTKSLAFYGSGSVLLATGTRTIGEIRGLLRSAPVAAGALFVGALAIAGAPPFAVFLSELTVFRAAATAQDYIVLALLLGFLAIAFLGILRRTGGMMFGQSTHRPSRLPRSMGAAMIVGIIPVAVLGVYLPLPLYHLLGMAAATLR